MLEDASGFGKSGAGSGDIVYEDDFFVLYIRTVCERETSFDIFSALKNIFGGALRSAMRHAREQMFFVGEIKFFGEPPGNKSRLVEPPRPRAGGQPTRTPLDSTRSAPHQYGEVRQAQQQTVRPCGRG